LNRISFTIRDQGDRNRLAELAKTLAVGVRVDIKQERRSNEQNSKFWAMLGEVSDQVVWHGEKLSPEEWKYLFLDAYKREIRLIRAIDGNGVVPVGRSSSDLSVAEMGDVITLIEMFGAQHSVKFKDTESDSADSNPPGSRLDAPAGESPDPHPQSSAGATTYREEASLLSPDWRAVYIQNLTGIRDKPASLHTRHAEAMQMIGGQPNEAELEWMRCVWRLVQRRNENKLGRGQYDQEIERLKTIPLSEVVVAA
jgi:hypothetical protein